MGTIQTGKCPKCDTLVLRAEIEHIDVTENWQPKWHGVTLVCQHCHCVLGASIDPVALKKDIVDQVVDQLFHRLQK
jgi:phage FluMu protein Com